MKLIPKQQNGGSFLSLFADYIPIEQPKQQPSSESRSDNKSSSSDKGKITEKDLFTLLKDVDGLPNEMRVLVSDIQQMYNQEDLYSTDTAELANMYAQNIYRLKHANFNKKEYDKAYNEVEKNQGLNEYAINGSGKLLAYNSDQKLTGVSIKDYLSNPEDYAPITNSHLLWLRAHDPSFVNNNQVFDIIQNGIGINKIEELIRDRMQNLGSTEQSLTGYSQRVGDKVMQGMKVLEDSEQFIQQSGMTLEGLYQTKVITKDQQKQAEAALQYIYQTLPNNARAILQLKAGNSENPDKGAMELIWNIISSKTSSSHTIESDYQKESGKSSGSSNSEGSLNLDDMTVASQFLAGYGEREQFTMNPGTNIATQVSSNTLPLVKQDGTKLGLHASLQEVSEGQFGSILEWNEATMGGRPINLAAANQILVTDGQIRSIDFPVDEHGKPDLRPTTLAARRELEEKAKALGIDINNAQSRAEHYQELNQLIKDSNMNAVYDSKGNIVSGNWRRFGVMNGVADNRSLGIDPLDGNNQLLQEITDEGRIDNIISLIEDKAKLDGKLPFDKNDWGFLEGGYDILFEGTIWIPLKVNYFNSQAGKKISSGQSIELEKEQYLRDRRDEVMRRYNPADEQV